MISWKELSIHGILTENFDDPILTAHIMRRDVESTCETCDFASPDNVAFYRNLAVGSFPSVAEVLLQL